MSRFRLGQVGQVLLRKTECFLEISTILCVPVAAHETALLAQTALLQHFEPIALQLASTSLAPHAGGVPFRVSPTQGLTQCFHCCQGDPHPGNMMRTPDGRLAILDFGLMTQIDSNIKYGMIEAISHLIHRDYEAIVEDFVTLDFIPRGEPPHSRRASHRRQRLQLTVVPG